MRTIDPTPGAQYSADMARKVLAHVGDVADVTVPAPVDASTGEYSGRHLVAVPSDSRPDERTYLVHVRWLGDRVVATHDRLTCEAFDAHRACWHLFAAVLRVAHDYHDGRVPVPEVPIPAAARVAAAVASSPAPGASSATSPPPDRANRPYDIDEDFYG